MDTNRKRRKLEEIPTNCLDINPTSYPSQLSPNSFQRQRKCQKKLTALGLILVVLAALQLSLFTTQTRQMSREFQKREYSPILGKFLVAAYEDWV